MKDGTHLMVDMSECDGDLSNTDFVEDVLVSVSEMAGMKIVKGPVSLYHEHQEEEERGVTAFAVIADSHICIHTYPFKKSLYFDLFSCKEFDTNLILKKLKDSFQPNEAKKKIVKR